MNPDCANGSHRACSGDGWDEAADAPMPCPCFCHQPRHEVHEDTTPSRTSDAGWRERAACRDEDFELFFPAGYGASYADQIADAKAVCGECPDDVRAACLERQMAVERSASGQNRHGIFGGLTPDERAARYRASRRAVSAP